MNSYSLYVGGSEVNDYPLTELEVIDLHRQFLDDGYNDAVIVKN